MDDSGSGKVIIMNKIMPNGLKLLRLSSTLMIMFFKTSKIS